MQSPPTFDESFFADPFPAFARLRQDAPVHKVSLYGDQEAWLVTRFDDVVAVLKDPRFSLRRPGEPLNDLGGPLESYPHLLNTDGLDHRRLRGLVSKGFTPAFVEGLRPRVRRRAHELIDAVEASGGRTFDLIEAFAFPLPIDVISGMLGLPPEDRERFRGWSDAIFNDIGHDGSRNRAEMAEFVGYLHRLFERKRGTPGDDLVSALVRAEEAGDALSEPELVSMVVLLIFAGHETTVNLLGNGVLALLTHPAQLERLRRQPELMEGAVEELLRLEGPVTMPGPRFALEELTLGEQVIRAGDTVVVALAAANRDEAKFTEPDELDIARELNKHVAFGQGVHYCLGAPLARVEAQEALAALLERFPGLALAADPASMTWRANPALRGLQALPLTY